MSGVLLLDIGPMVFDIKVTQGNAVPWTAVDQSAKDTPRDITGYTYQFTVYSEDWIGVAPVGTPLFTQAGAITDAPNGVVQFTPSAIDNDLTPKTYFFSIWKATDTGIPWTIGKGKYIIGKRIKP